MDIYIVTITFLILIIVFLYMKIKTNVKYINNNNNNFVKKKYNNINDIKTAIKKELQNELNIGRKNENNFKNDIKKLQNELQNEFNTGIDGLKSGMSEFKTGLNDFKLGLDELKNSKNNIDGTLTVNSKNNYWVASNIGEPNKNRVVIGSLNNEATIGSHDSKLSNWTSLYLNKDIKGQSGPVITDDLSVYKTLNIKGGKSVHNPQGWGTHFPWSGDGKNYIRGDTEMRGNTNNIGDINVGGKLCIGSTCITENDLKQFVKHSDKITIRSTHHNKFRLQDNGSNALFANANRGGWEQFILEKCGQPGIWDNQQCW